MVFLFKLEVSQCKIHTGHGSFGRFSIPQFSKAHLMTMITNFGAFELINQEL